MRRKSKCAAVKPINFYLKKISNNNIYIPYQRGSLNHGADKANTSVYWNENAWFTDRPHHHSLWLGVKLFLQLSDLGFQGGNRGLVLGLDGSFKLLQFQLQLLVLAIQLGASPLQLLGVATLSSQLCGQLFSLVRDTQDTALVKVKCAAGRLCTFSSVVVWYCILFFSLVLFYSFSCYPFSHSISLWYCASKPAVWFSSDGHWPSRCWDAPHPGPPPAVWYEPRASSSHRWAQN